MKENLSSSFLTNYDNTVCYTDSNALTPAISFEFYQQHSMDKARQSIVDNINFELISPK